MRVGGAPHLRRAGMKGYVGVDATIADGTTGPHIPNTDERAPLLERPPVFY